MSWEIHPAAPESLLGWIDGARFCHIRLKIRHFRHVLPSQSLSLVPKYQTKPTTQNQSDLNWHRNTQKYKLNLWKHTQNYLTLTKYKLRNCSYMSYTAQHRTVLITFPLLPPDNWYWLKKIQLINLQKLRLINRLISLSFCSHVERLWKLNHDMQAFLCWRQLVLISSGAALSEFINITMHFAIITVITRHCCCVLYTRPEMCILVLLVMLKRQNLTQIFSH